MAKKNIIILTCQDLSDYKNPIAPAFWNTINAYCDDGWRVVILNAHKYRVQLYKYQERYWYSEFPVKLYKISGVRKIGKIFSIVREECITKDYIKYSKNIIRKIVDEKEKCVIYAYEVSAVSAGKKISEKYNFPLVNRFQGTILYGIKDTLVNEFRRYPHFKALKTKADLIIMTDDGTKGNEVMKILGNKSRVLFYRNGVQFVEDSKRIEIEGVDIQDKVLMTLSRLAVWKHVDRALYAFPDVLKKYSGTKLVIIGYGEEELNLRRLAKTLSVSDNVIFTGQIKHEDTFAYLSRADIFLSLYDLSNVGNPLLEAMRCGKPIITLDVGDTGSIIKDGENGLLLNMDELDILPQKICQLLEDEEYAAKLGKKGKEYAEKNFWTWKERLAAELEEVNALISRCEKR